MKSIFRYYLKSFDLELKSYSIFRANVLFGFISIALNSLILFSLWTNLYQDRTSIEGVTKDQMLLYAFISTAFSLLLETNAMKDIEKKLISGDIAYYISLPLQYPNLVLLRSIAETSVNVLTKILPYSIVIWLFMRNKQLSIENPQYFVLSLALGYVVFLFYELSFRIIAFWTEEISGIIHLRKYITLLLSGSFIPLWFFPDWLEVFLRYLPFQAIFHVPLAISIGKIDGYELLPAITVQICWIIIFVFITISIWNRAVKRIIVNGG